jgi:uncharacterized protein (TIGR00251 family)
MPALDLQETTEGIVFKVYVQPRSSKNTVVGLHGDALKLKLTAPPVAGEANRQCTRYLAKCLGVSNSAVEIVAGHSSRTKKVRLNFGANELSDSEKQRLRKTLVNLANSKQPP